MQRKGQQETSIRQRFLCECRTTRLWQPVAVKQTPYQISYAAHDLISWSGSRDLTNYPPVVPFWRPGPLKHTKTHAKRPYCYAQVKSTRGVWGLLFCPENYICCITKMTKLAKPWPLLYTGPRGVKGKETSWCAEALILYALTLFCRSFEIRAAEINSMFAA